MFKYAFLTFLISLNIGFAFSFSPPLTPPLKAVHAAKEVSEDVLINTTENALLTDHTSTLSWLDDERFIYDFDGNVEIFNIANHSRTLLTKGAHAEVSPDGQWIAFIEKHDAGNQLWVIRKDGSQKRQLQSFQGSLLGEYDHHYGIAWSPNSRQLALFINPMISVDVSEIKDPPPPSMIQVIDLEANTSRQVYARPGIVVDLSWYPNGQKLLMAMLRIGLFFHDDEDLSFVQSVCLKDGSISILKRFSGRQYSLQPKLSPDGKQIALLYTAEDEMFSWMPSLGLLKAESVSDGPSIQQLTSDIKLTASEWSKNSQTVYVLRRYAAYNQIYAIETQTRKITQLTNTPLTINRFAISPDGSKMLWRGMDAHGKMIVRLANMDGSNLQDLIVKSSYKEPIYLSEVREVEWDTVDYPSKMRGLLFLPNHYQEGVRYPLIVDVHGGGTGAHIYLSGGILSDSPLEWQIWTKKGYAVFVPEFRSSGSFGALAILRDELQEHDIVNRDMLDVVTGVDELVRQGIVDNNRMAIIGHSAGGRRVNWLTVSSNRFKAIVSKEGWTDEWGIAMRYPGIWKQFGGSPSQVPENYLKNSALFHAKKGTTPTLFIMGNPKLGGVDPENTVRELHEKLKENGVETHYIEYPEEGHTLSLPKNRKDALDKTLDWMDRHLKANQTLDRGKACTF